MKVCIYCKKELPETEFYKSRGSKDGLQGYCKECCKKYREIKRKQDNERLSKIKERIFNRDTDRDKELEKEIEDCWISSGWSKSITLGKFGIIARYFVNWQKKRDNKE